MWQLGQAIPAAIAAGNPVGKLAAEFAAMEAGENHSGPANRFESLAASSAVSMADYSTMDPHKARSLLPREVWQGVLREGTLAILGGESKAKKSWFSLSLVMAAVAGQDFLGLAISAPLDGPRRVRVLDFEP